MERRVWLLGVLWVTLLFLSPVQAQQIGVKTNLLYWTTTTPNIGVEASVGQKHTLQLFYGINPWEFSDDKKLRHWVINPEYRYWFCESFNGWFVGAHLLGGEFNMGRVNLPFNLFEELEHKRYEGWFAGGGLAVGYQWMLARHWNFEASLGLGYAYIQYDKYNCANCGNKLKEGHRHYLGPTKAALSLVYLF